VQNWPAYEAGLRRRGSLILWIEDGRRRSRKPDGEEVTDTGRLGGPAARWGMGRWRFG